MAVKILPMKLETCVSLRIYIYLKDFSTKL